jgi:predicted RNA-binding Zn-ribbon protein involved in translation (DUF1610 family)
MLGDDMVDDEDVRYCARCGSDQRGPQIPFRETLSFSEQVAWDAAGRISEEAWSRPARYYQRTIGVEVWGVYDGMLYFMCPDCGYAWHRWRDTRMRGKAQPYIDQCNAKLTKEGK